MQVLHILLKVNLYNSLFCILAIAYHVVSGCLLRLEGFADIAITAATADTQFILLSSICFESLNS